ncbi:MAG: hypothetical protein ABUT39_01310 [Acidobacteriota bacterium]
MTATFETGLFGTTETGAFVKCLAFTLPQAASNTSHTISISSPIGVSVSIDSLPNGMSWNSSTQTLTILPTFTDSGSRLELDLSNDADAFFTVFLSSSTQNGVASSLEVNAIGLMKVTSVGTGVTFKGFNPSITSIPENAGVLLKDTLFLIPEVTGTTDFSFLVDNLTSEGSITITSTSSGISVSNSSRTVTAQSSLAPGDTATITVTYTQQSDLITGTFTIQRINTSSPPSDGGQSSLDVGPTDGFFAVRAIASNAQLRGNDIQYFTPPPAECNFLFHIATENLNYASQPVILVDTISTSSTTFTPHVPATGTVEIMDSGTSLAQTRFELATDAGTWDPTIINNGEPNPIRLF